MIAQTLAAVAAATGGTLAHADPAATVRGTVVVDSRLVGPGDLFVALPGERTDGHDFAAGAVAAGAVAVLATRPVGPLPTIRVADGQAALGALARVVVGAADRLTVVGITGSQGKTSTKDLLAQLLPAAGPTVAAKGSQNNEIGLPLTALRVTRKTRYLVVEMGARRVGDIAYLCGITPPTVGVVLNIGHAHLGEFGSRAAIATAKGELVEALPAGGLAVLGDGDLVRGMAGRTRARVVRAGLAPDADVRASAVRLDDAGRATFTLTAAAGAATVRLGLLGAHQVGNATAAAAVALQLGVPLDRVAADLAAARPLSGRRMQVGERAGVTVVNDAYNANPASMRAALHALVTMARGRRSVAVLGAMRELGAASPTLHARVGRLAARLGVRRLVVVGSGPDVERLLAAATAERPWATEPTLVPDAAAAGELLRAELRPGDVVLVKASRAVGLDVLADALLAVPDAPAAPAGGGSA